ncbi:MAG: hypothetical protein ACI8W8_003802 [Rhodothermales bacterium]|jgi:hypothetical protein
MIGDDYDIPPILHSEYEGDLFKTCVVCDTALLEDDVEYIIQRAIMPNGEAIEAALCMPCAEELANSYSEESRDVMERFFAERLRLEARFAMLAEGATPEECMDQCLATGMARSELREYHLTAHCRGRRLLLHPTSPFMLDSKVIEELHPLLSEETRRRNDNFRSRYINRMPDFDSILRGPVLMPV